MVTDTTAAALTAFASRHLPLARLACLHRRPRTLLQLPELKQLFRPDIERDRLVSLPLVGYRSPATFEALVRPELLANDAASAPASASTPTADLTAVRSRLSACSIVSDAPRWITLVDGQLNVAVAPPSALS